MYDDDIHKIIRVNHAGELGAKWICEGQLRYINDTVTTAEIQHMFEQEKEHLDYFEMLMRHHHVRPTLFMPLWKIMGRGSGAISAILGPNHAMGLIQAVEEEINQHYEAQINFLEKDRPDQQDLISTLKKFQHDECHHRDMAAEYNMTPGLMTKIMKKAVKFGVRTAIKLSQHI